MFHPTCFKSRAAFAESPGFKRRGNAIQNRSSRPSPQFHVGAFVVRNLPVQIGYKEAEANSSSKSPPEIAETPGPASASLPFGDVGDRLPREGSLPMQGADVGVRSANELQGPRAV